MLDFLKISVRTKRQGAAEIYPTFVINNRSTDLMIRGGDFYAIWVEDIGLWSTDEQDAIDLIDRELRQFAKEYEKTNGAAHVLYMEDSDSGSINKWHTYCQKQMRDNFHPLDETLIFSNTETTKKDYASKRLNYPLEPGSIKAYDKLISTLYSEEERHKIEWAIGSIVTGDSKDIQKFMVLYGSAGTGKSTILNIIQDLFSGYYSVFDAKALGSASNSFALEAFKTNPLVAIQHDGDLSKIEDNTRLNSLVSHEWMTVNEKFKSTYSNRFNAFLFMGTNKHVKITDAKSGLIRRLIDVTPSGNKLDPKEYKKIVSQVKFELGAIAWHCKEVYLDDPGAYDDYIPVEMMGASNDFYNYVIDSYHVFLKEDGTTLRAAWEMYKQYCEEARVPFPFSQRTFKEELKNYFREWRDELDKEGRKMTTVYFGFRTERFEADKKKKPKKEPKGYVIDFKEGIPSAFDELYSDCLAQYASTNGTPINKWEKVKTTLSKIDTSRLHYARPPIQHIVADFDLKDESGKKSLERNLEAASKWPATYAELSKSGCGIHLHYIYTGDVSKLSRVFDEDIEIKIFTGNSSLRRKLTKCNDLPIATISSGLPMKGDKRVIDKNVVLTEKGLRTTIKQCLNKEHHGATKPEVDFIFKILEDAYNDGLHYDVSDMENAVFAFAASSTNQSDYCIKLVNQMKFKSEEMSANTDEDVPIVFYDIEVFPNLFLVNWKFAGEDSPVVRMINPTPKEIEELIQFRLIGFNCRRYDNHLIYARLMGYTNEQLYKLSQRIISGERNAFFSEAYNLSYTDVYDFASAGNKKSLKKLEIEMGIHHQELGLPWDEPVDEDLWSKVAEYCDNDVIATEAAFYYLSGDWTARQILAELAGMTVNDSTNSLTTRIIFGNNKKPQNEFNWRDLSQPVYDLDEETHQFLSEACPVMMSTTHGEAGSLLPYFEGYKFENGKSTYRGEEIGEGGLVRAVVGMHVNVALLDVVSMHPHSTIAECLFGVRYTKAFQDIVEGRVSIKHKAWEEVNNMLDGKLTPFIQRVIDGELTAKDLANGLKTAINSVYGLTSANFENAFRDVRNKDNIVAKRGALFMMDLKHEVEKRGFIAAHIKTDSIKIPDATPEIIEFVMNFGQLYGYTFEHEATYDRMCLVNDAVYIAKYKDAGECEKMYGYIPGDNYEHGNQWTATGKQFAVPYLFKTLFSKEKIEFEDLCETFAVSKGDLYLDMNENLPDVSQYEKELKNLESKYKKGLLSDTSFEPQSVELMNLIDEGHDLHFVGRVGQFTPIKPDCAGGVLYRVHEGKNYAAPGSTGYRWLESEMVKDMDPDIIDRSFYDDLVNAAVEDISEFGDFEWFVSDDPYIPRDLGFVNHKHESEKLPFE